MIKISDATLRDAAAKGMDAFIDAFADAYLKETGGEWTAEKMALLNAKFIPISMILVMLFQSLKD